MFTKILNNKGFSTQPVDYIYSADRIDNCSVEGHKKQIAHIDKNFPLKDNDELVLPRSPYYVGYRDNLV